MNLHRTDHEAEWSTLPASSRNIWQIVAGKTNGWITPGNIITVIGVALTILGLIKILGDSYGYGLVYIAIGRILDVADGYIAHATGTKSPLGEAFDAIADKLLTAMIFIVFLVANIAPWYVLALLALPHVLAGLLAVWGAVNKQRLHPSRMGKISMALVWVALIGYLLHEVVANSAALIVIITLAITSIVTGLHAIRGYWRDVQKD